MDYLVNHKEIISLISEIFTAIGTVGAVIVALWFGYRDNKPKLRVSATVGVCYEKATMEEFEMFSCTNRSRISIYFYGFEFNTNRFTLKKLGSKRIIPLPNNEIGETKLPKLLDFSESLNQSFNAFLDKKTYTH